MCMYVMYIVNVQKVTISSSEKAQVILFWMSGMSVMERKKSCGLQRMREGPKDQVAEIKVGQRLSV